MNAVNDPKRVDGSHLPLIRGYTRFVLSFVGAPLISNRNCPILGRFVYVDKPIMPP